MGANREFGIVGLGRIGAGIAHHAIEKGMRVVGTSRSGALRNLVLISLLTQKSDGRWRARIEKNVQRLAAGGAAARAQPRAPEHGAAFGGQHAAVRWARSRLPRGRRVAKFDYSGQQAPEPRDPAAPENLWQSVPGDFGAHGRFDEEARSSSLQFRLARLLFGRKGP
jgi:hypothetical protein